MKILTLLSIIGLNVVKGYGVMGIDYGTDWLKISVVKNGIPLEVVLNKESKRKTDSVITFRISNFFYL